MTSGRIDTLEGMLIDGFGLKTASPLQIALCRAADGLAVEGRDVGLSRAQMRQHFGREVVEERAAPRIVVVVAGVRSGKSVLAGAAAMRSALFSDLSQALPHEMARVSVVAPYTDLADQTFNLLVGGVMSGPLRAVVVGMPTQGRMVVKREQDGRQVEIVVVAAHRGGATLKARWLAGVVIDESALFASKESGSAVTAEELLAASETRLPPGAQAWVISSPFGPQGLLYEMWKQHFGHAGETVMGDVLVVHAPTTAMNPNFDTSLIAAVRAKSPDIAAREYDAAWLDAESSWFSSKQIEAAMEASEEEPISGEAYVAGWDAATRGNAWTLVVGRRCSGGVRVSRAWQWIGSKAAPLDAAVVVAESARELGRYGVGSVHCDPWSVDALRPLARQHDLSLVEHGVTQSGSVAAYRRVDALLSASRLTLLSSESAAGRALAQDLKLVRKRVTGSGVRVELPTTGDGRHCDFAPALALIVGVLGVEADGIRVEAGPVTGLEGLREAPEVRVA